MMMLTQQPQNNQTIIVVGTGISGLMDAFALQQAGFTVSVYTKSPDPRINTNHTEQVSSTLGGGVGRFVSRFEGEHYLGDSPMYPQMKQAFQTHVTAGGWLGKHRRELTHFDKQWLRKRYAACDDVGSMKQTERFYVHANKQAMDLWQQMIVEFPELFTATDLLNTGILRLYDTDQLFHWAVQRHQKEGALQKALSPEQLAADYPYFSEAVDANRIAGGIEAPGFSFNIHVLTDNLITYLEQAGVRFNWHQTVSRIQQSSDGLVEGLVTNDQLVTAQHYAINPGAYSDEWLLKGTPAEGKLAGVAGRWLTIPSPANFKRPVKIHGDGRLEEGKKFPVVDINLTHFTDPTGRGWLAVGGGYTYVGKPPFVTDNVAFGLIDAENDRVVRQYLGETYRAAQKLGEVKRTTATCVRSFTYNDLPVMDNMVTVGGGVLRINAGTNTGTTTIAPFMAQETVRALT